MANRKIVYVEPAGYLTPEARKIFETSKTTDEDPKEQVKKPEPEEEYK